MSRTGRPAKPTQLKVLQGNPGRRPLNANEPKPTEGIPSRPEWLLLEAKREWSRIVPELASLGLLTKVDRAALVNYCQWWARWVEAEKILTEHGLTFETPNGYVQQRPEVAIAQKAASILGAYLTRFGLSPSDRARLTLPEKPAADPFAEFLSRKGESANA